ncbi:hypothetical protein [Bifidobacterium pseudocatenulatum]|uniref:hypothetical protein n=1 Tax=Bifidobacterium pseudocatenulatum TaxID=28026 RepID=UPI0015F7DD66|nr:hypothetical protein [Bifidobacterium pseudocatenulatum]
MMSVSRGGSGEGMGAACMVVAGGSGAIGVAGRSSLANMPVFVAGGAGAGPAAS